MTDTNSNGEAKAKGPVPAGITRIRLENFKGFREVEFHLGPFTTIVGANASGKSNFRDALRFLHGLARGYTLAETIGEKWIDGGVLQWKGLRGGVREVVHGDGDSFAIEVDFLVGGGEATRSGRYRVEIGVHGFLPRVVSERLVYQDREVFSREPGSRVCVGGNAFPEKIYKNEPFVSHGPAGFIGNIGLTLDCAFFLELLGSIRFFDLVPDQMREPSTPGQTILGDQGENLSSVLMDICDDPAKKSALLKWVRELTPLDVTDFEFIPDQRGRVLVTLVESNGRRISAYSASDGTLRFLALVAAFLGSEPARIYFFEELEAGLHPNRLYLLLQLIEQETGRRPIQAIATTHSPQLLTFLSPQSLESALLTYRLPSEHEQRAVRILDLPEAREVLKNQDIASLFAAGWLEDAVYFSAPSDEDGEEVP